MAEGQSERQSLRKRGREAVGRLGEAFTSASGTLTGKQIEKDVAEYSELTTQVLLGIHKDLQAQERTLHEHDSALDSLKRQAAKLRFYQLLAASSLVIAIASAGVAAWAAL